MTILGAIFAGGASRRFGGDKAAAQIGGVAMIDHVAARLAGQCDAIVVVGREWPGLVSVSDLPRPGMGPLGALAGALNHALAGGYAAVLSSGCDLPDLPADLRKRLWPGPAVAEGQPLLGLWPATLAAPLVAWLEEDRDRAMRSWIIHVGARLVPLPTAPTNINTAADLERFETGNST